MADHLTRLKAMAENPTLSDADRAAIRWAIMMLETRKEKADG
jgi:hypothetical protein